MQRNVYERLKTYLWKDDFTKSQLLQLVGRSVGYSNKLSSLFFPILEILCQFNQPILRLIKPSSRGQLVLTLLYDMFSFGNSFHLCCSTFEITFSSDWHYANIKRQQYTIRFMWFGHVPISLNESIFFFFFLLRSLFSFCSRVRVYQLHHICNLTFLEL